MKELSNEEKQAIINEWKERYLEGKSETVKTNFEKRDIDKQYTEIRNFKSKIEKLEMLKPNIRIFVESLENIFNETKETTDLEVLKKEISKYVTKIEKKIKDNALTDKLNKLNVAKKALEDAGLETTIIDEEIKALKPKKKEE